MENLNVQNVEISKLKASNYNPRKWNEDAFNNLTESISKYGFVDPILVNGSEKRKNVVIGGHFRLAVAKKLKFKEIPVVYLDIPDIKKEKELNIRLNQNTGEWDFDLLAEFDESLLTDIGFKTEELDDIFPAEENPEEFDLEKELKKLKIDKVRVKNGDRYQLGNHVLMCGNSMIEEDVLKLMDGVKANMCLTDPPYILDYLKGKKKKGEKTKGFGYKRDRRYIGTDVLPPDFTEKWMANVNKIQNENFSIIVYENWKNIRTIWGEMEKHWKIKNMIVWHLPNRTQGFASKYKFFSKHDIAMVGASGEVKYNLNEEETDLQNEYETALYATSGKPHWEGYKKGKKICPSDFIEHKTDDAKQSGQGVVFGTKPIEILVPYLKVLTKRNDVVIEPFGGSGSTLITAEKMNRKCYIMEKCPTYAEVIMKRWENLTSLKRKKL